MQESLTLYHGSQHLVKTPLYGMGKPYNDYGQGFYCTENKELAKEWACPVKKDGFANQYLLHTSGLNLMHLTKGTFNILNWLAVLLQNRTFDISNNVGEASREYLLTHFLPNTANIDVMIGYRADDSYFSFAEDFVNNAISVRDLDFAMRLGSLGEQVVLLSPKAFEHIEFVDYEIADYKKYYTKRMERDQKARLDYQQRKKNLTALREDIYVLDIIREEMTPNDPRLQSHLSE
jgi:hypothetical protein